MFKNAAPCCFLLSITKNKSSTGKKKSQDCRKSDNILLENKVVTIIKLMLGI